MTIFWILAACSPYDGLDPTEPRVQNARYVDCDVDAVSEIRRQGQWRPYFSRQQSFDEWGNLEYDRIELIDGVEFYQLDAEYRGQWLDRREVLSTLGGATSEELEVRDWDGIFLRDVALTVDGTTTRTRYDDDGVLPYTSSEVDYEDDGEIDAGRTFGWEDDRIVLVESDEGLDGSIDARRTLEYDSDGRAIEDRVDERDTFTYSSWEWDGPHDNLLTYRQESGLIDGEPSVFEVITEWNDSWGTSEIEQRQDGEVIETNIGSYDADGRTLTYTRSFPQGGTNPTRENWNWDCE